MPLLTGLDNLGNALFYKEGASSGARTDSPNFALGDEDKSTIGNRQWPSL